MLRGFREIDVFYETINLQFDHGKTKFKTYVGAIATLVMAVVWLGFCTSRFIKMV